MLDVIGAGFPRTGTTSMKAALERLGFGPCYHMFEILFGGPAQVERWLPLASGEPADWDQVFEGYRSAQDWPASYFWREQAAAYPKAKVVLTVRDPHAWYVSMGNLIAAGPAMLREGNVPPAAAGMFSTMTKLGPVLSRIGHGTFGGGWTLGGEMPEESHAVRVFEQHIETVKAALPPERLLVFDVREGWEPLCRFLGTDVPDEPFPRLNDSDTMRRMLTELMEEGKPPTFPGG